MVRGTSSKLDSGVLAVPTQAGLQPDEPGCLEEAAFEKVTRDVGSLVTPSQQAKNGAATRQQHVLL